MLNLSMMPLDVDHVDEICDDIIEQQRSGVSTHAMMMMYFSPIGTPAQNRAEFQCKKYDIFREKLDRAGAKHGVLVQSTMGHIVVPPEPHIFQDTINLVTGESRASTCCPLDENFRKYIKWQMHILAEHHPSLVMIDDDVGLLYRNVKGCACPLHMAEFNRRAGTSLTREELYLHTQGKSEENKRLTNIYVELQRDALIGVVKAMREGLDEVDPTIQGIVSGIYTSTFCEFSGEIAEAFAGKGNPRIVRMNNGMYTAPGPRNFSKQMYRAAILKENVKDKVDIFLAETDTCPQNRYSTSAALLHAHFTGTILEGATGAKHWITRLVSYEPNSGKVYRKKLAKHSKFYERLCEYAKIITPFGCKIPLPTEQNYAFVQSEVGINLSPWSTCVIERFGLPLYFGNSEGGAAFIDGVAVKRFPDSDFLKLFRGTLVLSSDAAEDLCRRGFTDYIGVSVHELTQKPTQEIIDENPCAVQVGAKELHPINEDVRTLSRAVFVPDPQTVKDLFPAVTSYKNALGGTTIVFSGTPDTEFRYFSAFSMLNESRKRQFVEFLKPLGHLPVYYPEDADVYLRAGTLPDGSTFLALFNLSLDELEEIPLIVEKVPSSVEMLTDNGELTELDFKIEGDKITINKRVGVLEPVIIIMK